MAEAAQTSANSAWHHGGLPSWVGPGMRPSLAKIQEALLWAMVVHVSYRALIRPILVKGAAARFPLRVSVLWAIAVAGKAAGSDAAFFRVFSWGLMCAYILHVLAEKTTADRFLAGVDGAIGSVFFLLRESIHYREEFLSSGATWLSFFGVLLPSLLLIVFLSLPQGDDEFVKGSPVDRQHTASILEVLTFFWPRKTFKPSHLKDQDPASLPLLAENSRSAPLAARHQRLARRLASHSLGVVLLIEYLGPLLLQSALAMLSSLASLGPNLVTYRLLQQLGEEGEGARRRSLSLVVLLGVSKVLPVLLTAWTKWVGVSMIDSPMHSTLRALVYHKYLSLPTVPVNAEDKAAQEKQSSFRVYGLSGHAVSSFSTCYKVVGLSTQLISTTVVLFTLVGWKSVTFAVVASLLMTPLTSFFMRGWMAAVQANWRMSEERSDVLRNALLAIRQIKLSATEATWKKRIYEIRERQIVGYKSMAWYMTWLTIVSNISPAVLSGIPIYVYSWQGHTLTASVAFTFISLFRELQSKLMALPEEIPRIKAGWKACADLEAFLRKEEIVESQFARFDTLVLHKASVTWYGEATEKETFRLENLNAEFPSGELSVITGNTGCGKSLLLAAIAGEAKILAGDIGRPRPSETVKDEKENMDGDNWLRSDGFALVSQNPWMDNATIRDNILFGLPMDEERYAHVLYCCALDKDLRKLKDGDMTMVTIRGVSLSGGQRSRIALARGLYSRASFLLMDDVLSAVDAEVREWIVEKALCGDLARGRTRILVTHHEEQVRSRTSYRLHIRDNTATTELVSTESPSGSDSPVVVDDGFDYSLYSKQNAKPANKEAGASTVSAKKETVKADAAKAKFRWAPYILYFNASGGALYWIPVVLVIALRDWNKVAASSYLEEWVSGRDSTVLFFLSPSQAYMLMSAFTTITMALRTPVIYRCFRKASTVLFNRMTEHVFGAPLQWLESTSQGEILQRCVTDMRTVDEDLTWTFTPLISLAIEFATVMYTSTSFSLYDTPFLVVLFYLFFLVGRDLIPVGKYLAAIEIKAFTVSGQHTNALSAPDGFSTVRAYGMKEQFTERANKLFDTRTAASWYRHLYTILTDFQLAVLGAAYVSLSCYTLVLYGANAGTVGVALSFAIHLSEMITDCLGRVSKLETSIRNAERVDEYGSLEQERTDGYDVPDSWPEEGEVEVFKYTAGYGKGLPDTLREVTFAIKAGERVGVVGRTGAGKSTLALSFAQLVEKRDGIMTIDSMDISRIKLEDLRKRILIIPQDPHLFGGTLRAILDPDDVYSDEELIEALEKFRFFATTANGAKKGAAASDLSFAVSKGGANLSQGQRQILCLVTAMLSHKKLVIMDEATSAVDMETDAAIQTVIRDGLQGATVLVIAHRLATVAHLDKVLVMHDGRVVEFGTPAELYKQEGQFYALVNHSVDKETLVKSFKGGK